MIEGENEGTNLGSDSRWTKTTLSQCGLVLRPVLEVNDRHPRIALPYVSPTLAERTSSAAPTFYALVNDMVYVNPRWMLKQRALMVDAMYAATPGMDVLRRRRTVRILWTTRVA